MATTSKIIYTHTCDLCGAEKAPDELTRLGLLSISEGDTDSWVRVGPPCDVCTSCQQRPIAELIAYLNDRKAEQEARRPPHTATGPGSIDRP